MAIYRVCDGVAFLDMMTSLTHYVSISNTCGNGYIFLPLSIAPSSLSLFNIHAHTNTARPEFTADGPLVIKQGETVFVKGTCGGEREKKRDMFFSTTTHVHSQDATQSWRKSISPPLSPVLHGMHKFSHMNAHAGTQAQVHTIPDTPAHQLPHV